MAPIDKRYSLDHKILIMQLLTRLISQHKLTVLPFYTYILKYLQPHQLRIPTILACLVQSVHDLTPPDILYPVVRKIAQEFCHPGVGPEVVAAGINAIRGVCGRQPWCLGGGEDKPDGENDDTGESIEEDGSALLQDLVEYRKSKDKGVMVAARSLLQLYREVNPGLLRRRERVSLPAAVGDTSSWTTGQSCEHGGVIRCQGGPIWPPERYCQ